MPENVTHCRANVIIQANHISNVSIYFYENYHRGVFRTRPKVYDEAFYESKYFSKKFPS